MTKEVLKLALEALQFALHVGFDESSESQIKKGDKAGQQHRKAITAIKEALAEQDSKDKEQAKTDSFVRQLDEALAQPQPWEKFCDSNCVWTDHHPDCKLAQPEQEPKCGAIIEVFGKDWRLEYLSLPVGKHKLYTQQYTYTTPPQRKPLTDEDLRKLADKHLFYQPEGYEVSGVVAFARAIEAAHGIKGEA